MRYSGGFSSGGGEGRNRTGDTTVFSRVLYRLSYLATPERQSSPAPVLRPPKVQRAKRTGLSAVYPRHLNLPQQPVAVIGAPLDLGQDRRGVDMGPSAIRYAGLERRIEELGRACADWGNVPTPVAEAEAEGDEELRFLEQIKATCARGGDARAPGRRGGLRPARARR